MTTGELFLKYAMIMMLLLPTALFAFLPLRDSFKELYRDTLTFPKALTLFCVSALVIAFLFSFVGTKTAASDRILLGLGHIPLFGIYHLLTKEPMVKKLFCFLISAMLVGNALVFGKLLAAPYELEYHTPMTGAVSGGFCLASALVLGIVYWKTLTVKIPYLLSSDALDMNWRFAVLVPLLIALLYYWLTPRSAAVVMTGRVRATSLAFLAVGTMAFLTLFQGFWRIAVNLTENARLKADNELMEMESKRFEELRSYMNDTRALRHDFRQHLLVMDQYTRSGDTEKLAEYIKQFSASLADHKGTFSVNPAVDAVASHYDQVAGSQKTRIKWLLEIPETLPIPESDYIAIFGNLVENAINAVQNLPEEKRNIQVTARMLSEVMMGLTVKNPYEGVIKMGKSGLPKSSRPGHGVGLYSVEAAVHRYNGVLELNTDDGIFTAGVVLYPQAV